MKKLKRFWVVVQVGFLCSVLATSCQKEEAVNLQKGKDAVDPTQSYSQDELVATPFGQISKSKVFAIDRGFTTKVENNQLLKIEESTGKVVEVLAVLPASINPNSKGQLSARISPINGGRNNLLYVHNTAPLNMRDFYTRFRASFIVPPAPTQTAVTIFTGLQMEILADATGQSLVYTLQYGPSAAGGGWYWSVTAWGISAGGNVTFYPISSTNGNANIAPGTSYTPSIVWDSSSGRYRINQNGVELMVYTPVQPSPVSSNGVPISDIYMFLNESPKASTLLYANDQCLQFTNVNVQANLGLTTVNWGDGNLSGPNMEVLTVVSNSSTVGQIEICFTKNRISSWQNEIWGGGGSDTGSPFYVYWDKSIHNPSSVKIELYQNGNFLRLWSNNVVGTSLAGTNWLSSPAYFIPEVGTGFNVKITSNDNPSLFDFKNVDFFSSDD